MRVRPVALEQVDGNYRGFLIVGDVRLVRMRGAVNSTPPE